MARGKRLKDKGRREAGGFVALPHAVLRSEAFAALSSIAIKLLLDLLAQFNGKNNGDLCAAWTLMEKRGWKSRETLARAKNELIEGGWLMVSRQGGRHTATLFAVTFYAVDECDRKLDIGATRVPSGAWKQ